MKKFTSHYFDKNLYFIKTILKNNRREILYYILYYYLLIFLKINLNYNSIKLNKKKILFYNHENIIKRISRSFLRNITVNIYFNYYRDYDIYYRDFIEFKKLTITFKKIIIIVDILIKFYFKF